MKQFIKNKLRMNILLENRVKANMFVPDDIKSIATVFKGNGYKLFIVGGAVRDFLLNQKIKDYDLATDAVPDKVEQMLNKAGLKTVSTGKAFGVINVFTDQGEYEIATFRVDSKEGDGRRPDSVSFTNIEGDVMRRDLTINALFYDIDTKEIVDLVGGVNDLKNGVVRTVGSPEERFNEDRLRILRAIRFSGRFGSELDPQVDAALTKNASLDGISEERIRDEFIKGIKSAKSVKHFLTLIDKYNLFDWIFKGLKVNKDFLEERDHILVISTLLVGNDPSVVAKQLNELKYTVDEIKGITFLINLLHLSIDTAVPLKRMQKNSGINNTQIVKFGNHHNINSKVLNAFSNFNLTVSGEELMRKLGLKQGKELGNAINKAEYENFQKLL